MFSERLLKWLESIDGSYWANLSIKLLDGAIKIAAVVIASKLTLKFGYVIIDRILNPNKKDKRFYIDEKKAMTLSPLLKSLLRYVVDFVAVVTILKILHIPTESIIATAGIGGLAIGFGAQNLVRDVITGFFIIFEDQFAVGDYINTAGISGIVEEMGLRVTKLRDFSGELHIVPNGEITKVTNHTRGNMRALVDVSIAYEEDIDRSIEVLKRVCEEFAKTREDIVEGPTVLGVNELGSSEVVIRIIAKTLPMQQWSVERELRKRIKKELDKEGIEIPYPHTVIIHKKT
ncbi:MAG: moderate conductance mechanosensitive channel [Thermosediminibacterales bacterium]|nr:moderate conductance mechanosensitive channel [Thermosediminibacterales bacterium]